MDARKKLDEFVAYYNDKETNFYTGMAERADIFNHAIAHSYIRQFTQTGVRTHIGISQLGKPAVQTAMHYLGYYPKIPSTRSKMIFIWGDVAEVLVTNMLKSFGLRVTGEQQEVMFNSVLGHLDGIIEGQLVFDVKTMRADYYERFTRQPDNSRGYLTQLGIYSYLTGIPGVFICVNKDTQEISVVDMPDATECQPYIDRAREIVDCLPFITQFEDVFKHFEPPQPVPEVFKKVETGRYLVPISMWEWQHNPVFYKLTRELNGYKKPTTYVTDFNTMEEARQVLLDREEIPF